MCTTVSSPRVQPHPFAFVYAGSTAILAGVARAMWRRSAPGARTTAILMLTIALWSAAYAAELTSVSQSAQLAWAPLEYIGILFAPLAWFVFTLRFTGRDGWLTTPVLWAFSALPIALYALVVTDRWHHWLYQRIETVSDGRWQV